MVTAEMICDLLTIVRTDVNQFDVTTPSEIRSQCSLIKPVQVLATAKHTRHLSKANDTGTTVSRTQKCIKYTLNKNRLKRKPWLYMNLLLQKGCMCRTFFF